MTGIPDARDTSCNRSWVTRPWVTGLAAAVFSLFAALPAHSFEPVLSRIGAAEGLPSADVEALALDRWGYVWIGTQGGLVRHEGHRTTVLRHDPDQPDSLPGNNIMSLYAARDGAVWAGISGHGIVRLEGTRISHRWPIADVGGPLEGRYVWSITEDCDGNVWAAFARDGLVRIDPSDGSVRHFPAGQHGIPEVGFATRLEFDSRCRPWLLMTPHGLYRAESLDDPRFVPRITVAASPLEDLIDFTLSADGQLTVAGDSGLLRTGIDDDPASPESIEFVETPSPITRLAHAADGALWFSMISRIGRLSPDFGEWETVVSVDGRLPEESELPAGLVTDVLFGNEGDFWIGLAGGGVVRMALGWRGFRSYRPTADGLSLRTITAMTRSPDGELWLGSAEQGIQRFHPERGFAPPVGELFPDREPGLQPTVIDLHSDGRHVWALSNAALVRHDRVDGTTEQVRGAPDKSNAMWTFLTPAPDGFFLATERTLLRIDEAGNPVDQWSADQAWGRDHDEPKLIDIKQDRDGSWWLLGSRSLSRLEPDGTFRVVHRQSRLVNQRMAIDGDSLWLVADSLLERYRLRNGDLERTARFVAGNGLPAGQVQRVIPNGEHVWLLMSTGLVRLDPEQGLFRVFSRSEGVPATEFVSAAAEVLDDGRIAASTARGLLVIDPEAVDVAPGPPPAHLTGLRAGDRRYELGPGEREPVRLDWRNNSLEFSFVALSYLNPARNRFRMRLTGWEENWYEQVGQTTRFYANVPPGRYRFEIQAANAAGTWNREGDAIEFEIAAPPWRSAAAYGLYGLCAFVIIMALWRSARRARTRRAERQRAADQQELAEAQRAVLQRLTESLEPGRLARVIADAFLGLSEASRVRFDFVHPSLSGAAVSATRAAPVEASPRSEPDDSDLDSELISLATDSGTLAEVRIDRNAGGLSNPPAADRSARMALLAETSAQVLDNARLLHEVRLLADQARLASQAKSDFLATMSHEIRTPLHGLLGMIELFEQTPLDSEQVDMVRTMRGSGRQLQRILNDVLDLSRIEANRIQLAEAPFDLVQLLERAVDLHASNADRAGLALRLRISANLPMMAVGDGDRIAQIVGNLISNAIKFTAAGSVEIEARMDSGGRLVISVSDTGPGIETRLQQQLFEPFTQLEPATTRRHSGTGLGLAICQRLVEAMNGKLDLVSEPGRGSRFSVRLPLAGLEPTAPIETRALEGYRLGSALPAAEHRVLMRLCRRWRIDLQRIDSAASAGAGADPSTSTPAIDGLLHAPACIDRERLSAIRAQGVRVWRLGRGHPGLDAEAGAEADPVIRQPLTESRLIAALLDSRFSPNVD